MIVSQKYQVQTDIKGNPIAFHKLRSIRIQNHPTPQISYSCPPSTNNIHRSSNNISDIQYMPLMVHKKKKFTLLEILMLAIILGTALVLTIDMYSPNNKSVQYQSTETNINKPPSKGNHNDNQQIKSKLYQNQWQQHRNHSKSKMAHQNSDAQRGLQILQLFLRRIENENNQQYSQQISINTTNNFSSLLEFIHDISNQQWNSFISLAYQYLQCGTNTNNNKYQKYCNQFQNQMENLTTSQL